MTTEPPLVEKHISFVREFLDFLKEYKVVGLAIGFVMAGATTTLVQSFVNNIIMPLISPLLSSGNWQTALFEIGPFKFGVGPFLAALLNFAILALVIFLIAKWILKEEKIDKKG